MKNVGLIYAVKRSEKKQSDPKDTTQMIHSLLGFTPKLLKGH